MIYMAWKDWSGWIKGLIIAFIVVLPYIFINLQKSLAYRQEGESLLFFFISFFLIALFKISFVLIMGAVLGFTAEKKKWILFSGLFGLLIAGFFNETLTIFIFKKIFGMILLESPIYGIIVLIMGFGIGTLIGFIVNKIKGK